MVLANSHIVIVPGAFHTGPFFSALLSQLLQRSFPTSSVTLPGVGRSDPANCSAQADADFIRTNALLPLLEDGKRVVVMHSYSSMPGKVPRTA